MPMATKYELDILAKYSTPGLCKNQRVLSPTEEERIARERKLLTDIYGDPPDATSTFSAEQRHLLRQSRALFGGERTCCDGEDHCKEPEAPAQGRT